MLPQYTRMKKVYKVTFNRTCYEDSKVDIMNKWDIQWKTYKNPTKRKHDDKGMQGTSTHKKSACSLDKK